MVSIAGRRCLVLPYPPRDRQVCCRNGQLASQDAVCIVSPSCKGSDNFQGGMARAQVVAIPLLITVSSCHLLFLMAQSTKFSRKGFVLLNRLWQEKWRTDTQVLAC